MKRWRLTDERIVGFRNPVEAGTAAKDLGRKPVSDASFHKCRNRSGGTDVADVWPLRWLEGGNGKLRKLLLEAMLDIEALKALPHGKT